VGVGVGVGMIVGVGVGVGVGVCQINLWLVLGMWPCCESWQVKIFQPFQNKRVGSLRSV